VAGLELDGDPDRSQPARLRERILPALEPLIAAALDRDRLLVAGAGPTSSSARACRRRARCSRTRIAVGAHSIARAA
jgi:hypothetical protein